MKVTDRWHLQLRIGLSIFYATAGSFHIFLPEPFLLITPGWVPNAPLLIFFTGLCEIAGAVGLMTVSFRKLAGVGLALYAICVYPANIKHALDDLNKVSFGIHALIYHIVRLPLQPVLVWLPLFGGGLVTWPFDRSR